MPRGRPKLPEHLKKPRALNINYMFADVVEYLMSQPKFSGVPAYKIARTLLKKPEELDALKARMRKERFRPQRVIRMMTRREASKRRETKRILDELKTGYVRL